MRDYRYVIYSKCYQIAFQACLFLDVSLYACKLVCNFINLDCLSKTEV